MSRKSTQKPFHITTNPQRRSVTPYQSSSPERGRASRPVDLEDKQYERGQASQSRERG